MSEAAIDPRRLEWLGQPRGLAILFMTEMWEKFSYFGMRTILVFYMTRQLGLAQDRASLIYGAYAALAYFTPLVGGVIADRWLGRRQAVIIGGLIMAAGHFMMTFPSLFIPALVTIATGNGLYLPSLPAQVAGLYAEDDPRRGSAYNVYYAGINIGAFLSVLVCGWLGETLGYHYGFAAAGIGMVTGLVIYVLGSRYLPAQNDAKPSNAQTQADDDAAPGRFAFLIAVVLSVIVFRGAYEQIGNTVALWADEGIDRHIGGDLSIPMTWFQAINPLGIILFTPPLVAYWTRCATRGVESSALRRMANGALIVAAAYFMAALITRAAAGGSVHWAWLVAFNIALTIGELYILPVGLGLFGRLAPRRLAAFVIAIWFSAIFAGSLFAGFLGTFWSRFDHPTFFVMIGVVAIVSSGLLLGLGRIKYEGRST